MEEGEDGRRMRGVAIISSTKPAVNAIGTADTDGEKES